MKINVKRIASDLHRKNRDLIEENTAFIEEINNYLLNDDILLVENENNAEFDVVLVESGGSEAEFVKMFPHLEDPILLLSTGKNNSLPAALEIKTYCAQNQKAAILVTGTEEQVAMAIKETSIIISAYKRVKNTNLGVIGEPSDWLIASTYDSEKIYDRFHINMIKISMDEFRNEIDRRKMEYVPHLVELKAKFKDQVVLENALYIYSALKRLAKKYKLHGLTVRCFDLLGEYKNTSCLALALLNEEGITCACEGDVPTLLTMHILKILTDKPSFQANPSYINYEKGTVLLAHCTLPLNMCESYNLTTHFESGLGIGVEGKLSVGKITICKIAPNLKLMDTLCTRASLKENMSLKGYCRTQINVECDETGPYILFKEDVGNHLVVTYGDYEQEFITLLNLFEKSYLLTLKNKK